MVAFASVACAEPDEDSKLSLQLLSGEEGKCTRGLGEMLICIHRGRVCHNTEHYVEYLKCMAKQSVMFVNRGSAQHCSYCACAGCLAARASSGDGFLLHGDSDCSSDLSDSTSSSHHSAIYTDSDSDSGEGGFLKFNSDDDVGCGGSEPPVDPSSVIDWGIESGCVF